MSPQRHVYPWLLALALVAGWLGTAHASKRTAHRSAHPVTHVSSTIAIGPTRPLDAACDLGALFQPADVYDGYIDVDNGADSYYTLLTPTECVDCPTDSQFVVNQVNLIFQFPVACTQPVAITFVGTKPSGSCPTAPNDRNVLAGPFNFNLPGQPTIDQNGAPQFYLTLPTPVLLTHPAFVGVTFNSFNDCTTPDGQAHTNLVIADSTLCEPCRHFNYYFDAGGQYAVDYCAANAPHFGPPIITVTGTCGTFVPTLPASWGQLKIRYGKPRRRRRRIVRQGRVSARR